MSSEEKTPVHKTSTPTHKSGSSTSSHRDSRQEGDSWEIVEGLKIGQTNIQKPEKHEGFMLKKRKWPLKGWHKRFFVLDNGILKYSKSPIDRFFVLDNGILKYSKSPIDIQKGKLHGSIDIGLSVMSIKKKARRIDLDTEEHIYHLKVKSQEVFDAWVSKLRHHRLYRQNEIVRSPRDAPFHMFPSNNSELATNAAGSEGKTKPKTLPWQPPIPSTSSLPASYSNGQSKVAAWLQESEEMDKCAEELANCQSGLVELSRLLQNLEILQRTQSAPNFTDMQIPLSASVTPVRLHSSNPNLCADLVDFQPPVSRLADTLECATDYIKLQEEYCLIAQKVHSLLKSAFNTVAIEKEKIKQLISEQEGHTAQIVTLKRSLSQALTQNAELMTRLHRIHSESVLSEQVVSVNIIPSTDEPNEQIHVSLPLTQQASNESRLSMSESVSEFFDAQEVLLSASSSENEPNEQIHVSLPLTQQASNESRLSMSESVSEFFDAQEVLLSASSSENEALTQNAELMTRLHRIHSESVLSEQVVSVNIIPSTDEPNEQIHVSLPLTQQASNESRLSMSESVSEFFDAQEVLLSASSSENEGSDDESYVSDVSDNFSEDNASVADNRPIPNGGLAGGGFRNGRRTCLPAPSPDTSNINLWNILRNNIGKDLSKVSMPVELNEPLNTLQHLCEELEYTELLDKAAETEDPYERMILIAAFAVSGYSSTYYRADSKPFNPVLGETYECIREDKGLCFFAEQCLNGGLCVSPGMCICPPGYYGINCDKGKHGSGYGDHYEWNKVTTCIHNILSGRRWIEHYGEITIRNTKSSLCICKLTFVKGNYWSSSVNEVQGFVMDQEGKVVHRLFGKWHEGLYCGVAPSAKCIWRPGSMPTDYEMYYGFTRFAIELNELFLEEGNVEAATNEKQRIEDLQRSRRRCIEENNIEYQPRFFKKVIDANQREKWVTNNTYWELRKVPGFSTLENPQLW
ncbi:UNVERIFIED_CONTAM: hypothetical protein FKN15_021958 [Acipenser sinensis]